MAIDNVEEEDLLDDLDFEQFGLEFFLSALVGAEDWPGLFELIEQRGFLLEQADRLGAFESAGRDLEEQVLPAMVRIQDWGHFLHYSLLALNLRHLAESLAEPVLLRALVQGGKKKLARDVADRIADPLRRSEARAVLADTLRMADPESCQYLIPLIEIDLDENVPPPLAPGEVEDYADRLATVADCLGSGFSISLSRWSGWIQRLVPSEPAALRVRTAVAEAFLTRTPLDQEGLWQALAAVNDVDTLLRIVPAHLSVRPLPDLDVVLERLAGLFPSAPDAAFRAGVRLLDGQSGLDPARALVAWDRWSASRPIPWSLSLVEEGRHLFGALSRDRREALLARLGERTDLQVALRVMALEANRDAIHAEEALAAIERLPPDGASRLHWSLRYLRARPAEPVAEVRSQVAAVLAYVAQVRYAVPPPDLRLCLDLVADLPDQPLPPVLEDVASSPATCPEALRLLADESSEPVLTALLEQAERYAALVSANEAEGFRLRGELIQRCVRRLCLLRGGTAPLAAAVERLLPDEEDELRSDLAEALAAAGQHRAAGEACEGIRERRRKFLTQLRIVPEGELDPEALSANSLYKAVASVEPVEAERLGLTALTLPPVDLQNRVQTLLAPIRDTTVQSLFLLRLAWHTLAFEEVHLERYRDPVAPLEMVRHGISISSDEALAALTPAIARLGASAGPKQAAAEFEEAFWRLASLESLPASIRLDVFEDLLACLDGAVLERKEGSLRRRHRAAAEALASLARLPARMEEEAARATIRAHWPELLPRLIASADRLPDGLPKVLKRALVEGIAGSLDGRAAEPGSAASILFDLCQAPCAQRIAAAEPILEGASCDPLVVEGLCYLLAAGAPGRVPALLAKLPPERRDPLGVRLLRHGWLRGEAARVVPPLLLDPSAQALAAAWAGISEGYETETWWTALDRAIQEGGFDPSSPGCEPLLSRLWASDPEVSWPALARSAIQALKSGGRLQGERALRLWLHAYLHPRLGQDGDLACSQSAGESIARALSLKNENPMSALSGSVLLPQRLTALEKLWPGGFWDAYGIPRGKAWDLRRIAYVVTFVCLIGMVQIELFLWLRGLFGPGAMPTFPPALPGNDIPVLFLALPALLNGWILDRYLSDRTPGPFAVARWLRLARAAVLSIPILGLWAIPAWQRIQSRRPGWAFRPAPSSRLDLRSPRKESSSFPGGSSARLGHWWRRSTSSFWALVLWLIFCQVVPFNTLLSALIPAGSLSPERMLLLIFLSGLCHLVVYLGVTLYLGGRRPRALSGSASDWRFRCGPPLLLLPLPFPLLSFLIWLPLTEEAREEKTLTYAAQAARFRRPLGGGVSPRQDGSERFGLALLGLGAASAFVGGVAGRQEELRQSLYRLKSAFLILEGAAVSLLIVHLGGKTPLSMSSDWRLLSPFLGLAVLGFLSEAGNLVRRAVHWLLRRPLRPYLPIGHFLAVTEMALPLGAILGVSLAFGKKGEIAILLQFIGWTSFTAALLLLPIGFVLGLPGRHVRVAALWMPLFLSFIVAGWLTGLPLFEASSVLSALEVAALAAPLAGLILGWLFLPSLLHPFIRRDLFAPELAASVRARLAFLSVTALLPLGGIAAPLWMILRLPLPELYERHRLGAPRSRSRWDRDS